MCVLKTATESFFSCGDVTRKEILWVAVSENKTSVICVC